ncbi:hypothetical protein [Virgibacillus senegalensis]|uniref:hypothetical protein n=1 Tax=Virgibacillus senegalensis TaxID=1499679 RepID=UPI00069CFE95|nr:hypothetical protein [Virgibacillus senegalensis]
MGHEKKDEKLHICPMCFGGGIVLFREYDDPETNFAVCENGWCTYCEGIGRIPSEKLPPESDEVFTGEVELPEEIMKFIEEL